MARMIGTQPFHAVTFAGRRFDCGSKVGFVEATLALALEREDMGDGGAADGGAAAARVTGAAPAPAPAFQFADFDTAVFLRDCWQQKPCLIRNPWVAWANPLDPDDLAGLACEPGVESRMIHAASERLAVEPGPLAEESFARPGKAPWTLLVQGVDHHVPEVAALIAPFRFIPDWRIDDVMVSYAVDGGGVGAHFDHYDVFLVQGLGKRRWQVGGVVQRCHRTARAR